MGTKNLREKGSIDFINVSNFNEYAPKIVIRHSWKESLLAPNRFISISICTGVPVCSSWDYVLWNNYCIWINTKLGGIFRPITSLWSEYEWLSTLISAMVVNSIVILRQSFLPPKLLFLNRYLLVECLLLARSLWGFKEVTVLKVLLTWTELKM